MKVKCTHLRYFLILCMILNASSTTIDTTWVTPTLTTTWMSVLPPPCLNNRTRSPNLKDFCGNYSANIICDVDNSTCMVSSDGDWRCQCMKGFYQVGHMCERVPDSLFGNRLNEVRSTTVQLDPNENNTQVYTIPTRINSSSTTCSVSNSDFFYCINMESSVDVYIRHSIALTDMTDAYKVSVFGSTNVENNVVFGQLNLIVNVIKPVPVLPVLVSDRVIRGQIILHLPIASNILFSLNDTRFEVNDNNKIILLEDLSNDRDASTVFFTIPVTVTETLSSRERAIIAVNVIRTRLVIETSENLIETVAIIENPTAHGITLKGDDSDKFLHGHGKVKFANAIDYDNVVKRNFNFQIQITVQDKFTAVCNVNITLTDVDDEPPKFSEELITVKVTQSTLMTFVMNLNAADPDTSTLNYTLRPDTSEFIIRNGFELWKKSALYASNVTVVVSDLVNMEDTMEVFVEIEAPISQDLNLTFSVAIDEEEPIGRIVLSIRNDARADNHENFQFFDNRALVYFHLDNSTGNVTLAKQIDRDTDQEIQSNNDILTFYVRATEKGTTCSFVNLGKIEVHIRDINDNTPVFMHDQYTATVVEESKDQVLKITPVVQISDSDKSNTFEFFFLNYTDFFGIRKITDTTFEIFTKQEIDRDNGAFSSFTLYLNMFDGVNMNRTTIEVSVLDINDNKPQYMSSTYRFSVKENSELSTSIAFLYYTDSDDGLNSELLYGDDTGFFSVYEGVLSVDGPLDREAIAQHTLSLTVCDKGVGPCTVDVFTIDVEDENDNVPNFMSPLGVTTLPENHNCSTGNTITTVIFEDYDEGENGRLTYRILSASNIFNIVENSGEVICIGELDFDFVTEFFYTLDIEACDNGSPQRCSPQESVYIRITDVNDNFPVFLGEFASREYETAVEQSDFSGTNSKPIALVSATDYDSGRNGELTYSIRSGNGTSYVDIDSTTGLLKSKSRTNPTQGETYSIVVNVRDNGQPPLTNQTYVYFTIKQTTATFEFNQTDIVISVLEEELFSSVLNLTQFIRNTNGVSLKYSIPSSQELSFTVNGTSGIIDITKEFDREVKDKILFPVRASNDDASALALVRVEVRDINDNGPSLSADLRRIVALPEDTPTGSVILNVTATDPDAGNNAITRFSLTAEPGSPAYCTSSFRVDETTGSVTLETKVDFDILQETRINTYCIFQIKATDAANSLLTSAANITIEILDVNDNIPIFVGSTSTLQIPEGAIAAEQFQWLVSVTDADKKNSANGDVFVGVTNLESCPFNVITRKIKDNDKSLSFSPRDNTELDFETKKEFDCQLIARDKGTPALESNFSMVITLNDVNDNAPYVIDGPYVFNVSRYIPTDHVIVQKINASDMDVGQNAQLTFSKGNVNSNPRVWDYFSVSQSDGRIRVYRGLKSLDFDEVVLNVNISDRGLPVNFTVYPITIYLEDDNQRPYFDKLPVSVNVTIVEETRYQGRQSIFENIPGFPLRAKDDQKTVTVICNCTYYLQNNYGLFEVDQSTADIYLKVNQFVDREVNSSISIELFGLDNGLPRQRTIPPMVININIDDINDNAPEFTQTNYQALIFQDHPINAEVVKVSAVDTDLDDNALTQYSIVSVVPSAGVAGHFNQSTFSLHENNGTIFLSSSVHLDTTETFFFVIIIRAIDVNKPTFTDTARVTVTVRYNDPNKHAPRFAQDVYSHRLMLDEISPGDSVLTITATDADPDTTIMHSIIQGNIRDTFEIQHDDGDSVNITLKYPVDQFVIDRLQDPRTFTLVISAVDNGVIPKTGTTTVVMRLDDDPQKCDLGFQKQTLKTTTLSTPAAEPGFESAMYVMVGVVSVLLISNTIFILKYCRARSLPLRRNGFYPTGHSKKPSSKRHDGEFHKIKGKYGHFITPDYDWTANVAYKTNRDLSRGFPPPLPPRRGGLYPPVVY